MYSLKRIETTFEYALVILRQFSSYELATDFFVRSFTTNICTEVKTATITTVMPTI
jgi:hypothetical protein